MISFDSNDSISFNPWSVQPKQQQQPLIQDLYDPSNDYYPQYYNNNHHHAHHNHHHHHHHHQQIIPIKLEESTIMVPSQPALPSYQYQHQQHHQHPHHLSHHVHSQQNQQHPGAHLSVQHTDDAASKETQYLRRRCFNCHTTEPPSWRRSTLNPGKIVCNKCGLYERTHLRPRPLRFDELRSGGKPRKTSTASSAPPGLPAATGQIPKKPKLSNGLADGSLVRRSSVSSNSSVHSSSDWDDSISVYSTGSGPQSSASPPTTTKSSSANGSPSLTLSLPLEMHLQQSLSNSTASSNSVSSSPNLSSNSANEIRLPGNPLIDLSSHHAQYIPRKAHTSPAAPASPALSSLASTPSLSTSASSTPPLGSLGTHSPSVWTTEPEDIGVGLGFGYPHPHSHAHQHPLYTNGLRRSASGSPRA